MADSVIVYLHLNGPDITVDDTIQVDFPGMDIAMYDATFGYDNITFRFDTAVDFTIDMQTARTPERSRYFCAGRDDGGMACAAM